MLLACVTGILGVLGGAGAVPLADAAHVGGVHRGAAVREVLGAAALGPRLPPPARAHRAHPRALTHTHPHSHTHRHTDTETLEYYTRKDVQYSARLLLLAVSPPHLISRAERHPHWMRGFDAAARLIGLFQHSGFVPE